jgi:hypothetical protein
MRGALALARPFSARRRGASPWWLADAYRLDGVTPALAADFARWRFALAGAPVPLSSVLAVSSGAKRVFDASGALATVPADTPAFTWRGGKRRLLIEGPATNLLTYSDPRQWVLAQGEISDGPIGPDGVTPWCRVNDNTTSGVALVRQTVSVLADTTTYVASILVLHDPTAVSSAQLRVQFTGGTTQEFRLTINPITGALGDTSGSPVAIYRTDYGDFSLIELVCANNGTNTSALILYFPATSPDPAFTGTPAPSPPMGWGYVGWGQFEVGTRATSRILSAGSQGSRIADVVQLSAGAAATLQGAAASLAWRGRVLVSSVNMPLVGLPSGYALLRASANSNNIVLDGSSSSGLILSTGVTLPGEVYAAIGWDGTGRAGAVSGEAAKFDSASLDRSRAGIWLGGYQGLATGRALELDELVVWPVRGSNAALTAQARGWA